MIYKNFQDFLHEKHSENYHGTDDDMPEAFEGWLEDTSVDTIIFYADTYGVLKKLEGLDRSIEILKQ